MKLKYKIFSYLAVFAMVFGLYTTISAACAVGLSEPEVPEEYQ